MKNEEFQKLIMSTLSEIANILEDANVYVEDYQKLDGIAETIRDLENKVEEENSSN